MLEFVEGDTGYSRTADHLVVYARDRSQPIEFYIARQVLEDVARRSQRAEVLPDRDADAVHAACRKAYLAADRPPHHPLRIDVSGTSFEAAYFEP